MKIRRKHLYRIRQRLVSLTSVLILVGGYWVYSQHHALDRQISTASHEQVKPSAEKSTTPASVALSYNDKANYPQSLIIKKLAIEADVLPMGILDDGTMEAPKSAWNVGWYDQSALPGSRKDALLIDGHVNDQLYTPGIFYKIDTLQKGDKMTVVRGDGERFTYRVIITDERPIEDVDMAKMMRSITPGKEGLNLITCGGTWDEARKTYDKRILVYAERI